MADTTKKMDRVFTGVVVSDKMDKTIVVRVDHFTPHRLYGKRIRSSRKYHVHDPKNQCTEGEKVTFKEVRPLAKTKRWTVIY